MYNEFYGFSEKPFETTPDPKFIYFTPHHQDLLDSVIRGIKDRQEFISVTGAAGTGKTALFYYLLSILEKKIKGVLIPRPFLHFREFVRDILLELNSVVVHESNANPFDQLIDCLNQMGARDERLVLIIDEAQNLSREVMEELQLFIDRVPNLVQIIFVGQPRFEDKINSAGLRSLKQKIEIQLQMKALSEVESSEYIDHRLRLVGGDILELFTPKAISMIFNYTQGTPLGINILCDNGFRIGYTSSQKRIDVDIIQQVIRELEGPGSSKSPSRTVKNHGIPLPSALRLNGPLKIVLFVILALVCLGGLIFLVRVNSQKGSVQWGDFKTIKKSTEDVHPPEPKTVPPEAIEPPSPPSSLPAKREEEQIIDIVTVKEGQSLSFLSQKYYRMTDTTLIDIILDFNPEITNPHLILINQEIKIPRITEELFIARSSEGTYKIYVGTFLTADLSRLDRDEPPLAGKGIEIIPKKISSQETWHRVVVGTFDNREEALKAIHLLKEKGYLPSFGKSSQ